MKNLDANLADFFMQILAAHKINAEKHDDWVTVGGGFPAFRAAYEPPQSDRQYGVLYVQVMLDAKSLIEESFAAFGGTEIEAIQGALLQFNISMFHPILAAYGIDVPEDQVTRETWRAKNHASLDALSGNIAMRYSEGVSIKAPADWVGNLAEIVSDTDLNDGFNWITAYFSRTLVQEPFASTTLNNEPWDIGLQTTLKSEWPKTDGFYGARLFVLIHIQSAQAAG